MVRNLWQLCDELDALDAADAARNLTHWARRQCAESAMPAKPAGEPEPAPLVRLGQGDFARDIG
jgi:hypothetical protein